MNNLERNIRINYILIDYENVQPASLNLPKNLLFKVIVFIGANQIKIPIELATSMQNLGHNAEYVRIEGNGKNALDFHLTFYLGKIFEKDSKGYFHIISKDSGFDILVKHLQNKKVLIQRYDNIDDIPALKISLSKNLDEKILLIIDYLNSRDNAKPKKVEALYNTINSLFSRTLNNKELETIINKMREKKLIYIEQTKVRYTLD